MGKRVVMLDVVFYVVFPIVPRISKIISERENRHHLA
ncbi:hypothetical protein GC56T2_0910 [Geobacillus sp. C56-T2]|nr:hypothetical protein GC56T2_0910 [Geobacillus sp. C56-T2]